MYSPIDDGWVSSEYGPRGEGFHAGIDLRPAAGWGTPVRFPFSGVIEAVVGNRQHGDMGVPPQQLAPGRTGNGFRVRRSNGERFLLGHMAPGAFSVGQSVTEGDVCGTVDNSGNTSGPHVHFETWNAQGQTYNPRVAFDAYGVTPGKNYFPPEEDVMESQFKGGNTGQALRRDTWNGLWLDQNRDVSLLFGPMRFTGEIRLQLSGLPVGREAQVRVIRVMGDSWDPLATWQTVEIVGTGGGTFGAVPFSGDVLAGERLRFTAAVFDDNVRVERVEARALWHSI